MKTAWKPSVTKNIPTPHSSQALSPFSRCISAACRAKLIEICPLAGHPLFETHRLDHRLGMCLDGLEQRSQGEGHIRVLKTMSRQDADHLGVAWDLAGANLLDEPCQGGG